MNNAYTAFDQFETLGYRGVAIFGPDEQAAGDGAGKRPCSGAGWQNHAPETHRACLTSIAGRNVGILCAHGTDNTAIDIDCDFPEIAAVLETLPVLAWLPRRYGNKPRVLFPCKIKNVSDKGTAHDLKFRHADGREFTIQIIRGQYVAWGVHPKTRRPYEWVGDLPPSANLPYIDYAAFVRQAVETMGPLGFTTKAKRPGRLGFTTKNDRPGVFAPLPGDLTDEEKRTLIETGERIARGKAKRIDNGSDRRDTHVFAAASYWRALIDADIVTEERAREIIDDHLAAAAPHYEAQVDQGLRKGNDTAFKELCARRAFFATAAQQQAAYMAMQSPVAQPSPNVAHEVCEIAQIAQGFARNMAAYNCGLRCPENVAQDMRNAITQLDPGTAASFDTGLSHQHAAREAATAQRAGLSLRLADIAKYFDMTKARTETREIGRILGVGGNIEVDEAALMAGAAGCDIALVAALRAGYEEGRSIASRDMKAEPATGDMIDDYSPFMIDGLLDQRAMSVVFGASNAGKTFVLMDLAYRVAMGNKWQGRATSQSTVIYVAAEGGRRIKKRVAALQKKYGKTKNFQLVRYPIDLCTSDVDLDKLTHLVLEALQETGSANCWVIVDTLARALAGGDENSSVDMGNIVRAADAVRAATGAHFTYVHHTGKDEARGLRGHSNLLAACRT